MKATKARTKGQARRAPKTQAAVGSTLQPQVEGPPVHALRHGRYARSDAPRAPYVNSASTYLGRLLVNGAITKPERMGGEAFADTYRLAWSVGGRDSTILPIGGWAHETVTQADRMCARNAKLHRALNLMGPVCYAALVSAAVFEVPVGRASNKMQLKRYADLRAGLRVCIDVFSVPAA